ncbi:MULTISPECIES: sugar phosphate isomerase/epimerase family protein [unclassified Novosphingobium]|uniref:sugar phosphate isomerase/epimerase family protein n=1 Tax=Novosphingobium TaxID=165696 RepID=UPI0014474816|nr:MULTISPECIES: sugar phosphate isomerase/epimerase [unclassified Novosphingobium]NKJ44088.1 sugar phosphate isomerase/epimerase [Novosphingobium sp. SG720]NMN05428.1 sugar phosphate isomerase/epimerase [Novosphingobium sp. SG919]NMN87723.1 sugar phosphate isomerase/epimerase [Novosphingobium sp. SG916]
MLSFGVDLITFFHPGFWDLPTEEAVVAHGKADPRAFWDRMLDTLAQSGVRGIELTFSPFGADDLIAAYGSHADAAAQLAARGLAIAGGFFADIAIEPGLGDPHVEARWLERGEALAAHLAGWGAQSMVIGLPMRTSWDAQPPVFADLALMQQAASLANRLGARTLHHGVRLALHTEAHSIFSQPRDIDLLLLLTDPVYVGFCPDSAHILLSGGDPVAIAARHAERIAAAHWKDARGTMPLRTTIDHDIHRAHRPFFTALGTGKVDLPGWAAVLATRTDLEWAILEIDAVADPLRAIRASLAYAGTLASPLATGASV